MIHRSRNMSLKDGFLLIPGNGKVDIFEHKRNLTVRVRILVDNNSEQLGDSSQWKKHYGDMTTECFDLQSENHKGELCFENLTCTALYLERRKEIGFGDAGRFLVLLVGSEMCHKKLISRVGSHF
ncbi:hypothetical protein NPIL_260531 [Nephila pilipes]|uniref:Uncharacterized protein n=1 Tax=Nephila pilipes TaxID=299642 RepID=A0A8X6PAP6_NEPPI|nr:hypothetical protein NPIL_260531 [Nephila pilipes]